RKIEIKELPRTSPPLPKKAADIAAFLAGTWKTESVVLEPKLPPDQARATGISTHELIAGGKFLRGYGSYGDGRIEALFVQRYDAGNNTIRGWFFTSSGQFTDSGIG